MSRPNWKHVLDHICDSVIEAEGDMRDRWCVLPAQAGALTWSRNNESKKFRIMLGDKPLAECSVLERAQHLKDVEVLMDAADAAMAEAGPK